jgi:hypothetical protein
MKSGIMRWMEYIACIEDVISEQKIFVGELGNLEDRVINWRIILEYNREIVVYDVYWSYLVFDGDQWQAFKHSNKISVSSVKENLLSS